MPTKKPTAPQARFLAAIHKAGGVSAFAMHEVVGTQPIARCIAAGWAEQLDLPGGHAGQVMHAITPAGCEALGLGVLPVMPDCANCIGLGHVFGGHGATLAGRTDLDEPRNRCVWCKGTGKGTAAVDSFAAMTAAAEAVDARWQEDLAAPADGCPECGEHHQAGIDCRTPEQILAECAPPAGYADRFRVERAASLARLDAHLQGLPAHSVDLNVTAPDEPVDPAAEQAAAGHWPTGDEVDEALDAWAAVRLF